MSWQSQQRFKQRKQKNKENYQHSSSTDTSNKQQYYPKNRVRCAECDRLKLLFDSESKANRYIQYNKDTVVNKRGERPVRAYYCQSCGGWHVTHKSDSSQYDIENPTDTLINAYRNNLNSTAIQWNNVESVYVVLDEVSQAKLIRTLKNYVRIPDNTKFNCNKILLYHYKDFNVDDTHTLKVMNQIDKAIQQNENIPIPLSVNAIGLCKEGVIFKVPTVLPNTTNKDSLYIVAFTYNNSSVDNFHIERWQRIPKVALKGNIHKVICVNQNFLTYNLTAIKLYRPYYN